MSFCIIVNPNAGKKQGLQTALALQKTLDARNISYEVLVSDAPGQDLELARSIQPEDFEAIVVVGGDGTLFEVLNGLLTGGKELTVPVGVIPAGTGNSFIKDLGIKDFESALKALLSGNTREVDLGEFSYEGGRFFFANLLGAGFVSNVAYRAGRYKKLGALSYVFGVLEELMVMKSTPLRLDIDGKIHERRVLFVEICNSRYTGGDMMMAPDASIDDGLFDIIVASHMSRIRLLRLFPAIFKGEHINDPMIEVFRGSEVKLDSDQPLALTPDGETFGTTPLQASVHPRKIRMFY